MLKKMKIMKRNLFLVLPLLALIVLGEACSPKSDNTPPPPPPLGTFSGTFKVLAKKTTGTGLDTIKKDPLFTVKLSLPANYVVTQSTPSIHALSRGAFQYNSVSGLIAFYDSTYVAGPQPTVRLRGTYQYGYDGASRFQLQRVNTTQDTLWFYDLKKTSN